MGRKKRTEQAWAGGDVSAKTVDFALERSDGVRVEKTFANDSAGHKELVRWLRAHAKQVRVVIESSGIYSLDLALALHRAKGIEVMVANPRAVADFARALMQRSKTDRLDARAIREFAMRMPFEPWDPPPTSHLDFRALMRRICALKLFAQQESNRLHASSRTDEITRLVGKDIEAHIRQLQKRIERLEDEAHSIVVDDPSLAASFALLVSAPGIARTSALHILAELVALPSDMTARQWVAHAGLDPRHHDSGTSVHKKTRISRAGNRYLRAALYMPALVASQRNPHVRAFYLHIQDNGKTKMQAVVAVMRKLLHAIWGMLHSQTTFNGQRFYAGPLEESLESA